MAGENNVGTVTGKIELDAASVAATLGDINTKLDAFGQHLDNGGEGAKNITEGIIGAEAAMKAFEMAVDAGKEELEYLIDEGSKAGGIRDAFDHLTEGAGLSKDVLGQLGTALHGTVDDVTLMKSVNTDLSAGLHLTSAQYDLIAKSAFALSKAEGIDVKDAFEQVNDAMVKGQARGVAMLTGRISQIDAEQKYATALGTTVNHLSEQDKIDAQRQAILDGLTAAQGRLGDTQMTLSDRIQAGLTSFENFNSELGESITKSPVLTAALDNIGKVFTSSLGDKDTMIQTLTHLFESGTIIVVDFGIGVAAALNGAVGVFTIAKGVVENFYGALKSIYDFAHGNFKEAAGDLKMGLQDIADGATGNTKLQQSLEKVEAGLFQTRDAMVAAQKAEDGLKTSTDATTTVQEKNASILAATQAQLDKLSGSTHQSAADATANATAWEHLNELGTTYQDTLKGVNQATLDQITYYLKAGASTKDVSDALNVNIEVVKADAEAIKAQTEGYKELTSAVDAEVQSEDKLNQTRLQLQQNSVAKQVAADEAALKARYAQGLIDEQQYQDQLTLIRDNAENKAEGLYRQQATAQEQASDDANQKAIQKLEDSYNQGKIDSADYQAALTALEEKGANDRAAIEDKYQADRKDRQDAANADMAQGFATLGDQGKQSFDNIDEGAAMLGTSVDNDNKKVLTLDGELQDAAKFKEQMDNGGSFDVTSANLEQTLSQTATPEAMNNANLGNYGGSIGYATQLAKQGYSFAEIMNILRSGGQQGGPIPPPQGPRIPGFADGGVGDFGDGTLAMLHGQEAIVPLDQSGALGTTVNVTFQNVNGTGKQVAQEVSNILMQNLKKRRLLPTAG